MSDDAKLLTDERLKSMEHNAFVDIECHEPSLEAARDVLRLVRGFRALRADLAAVAKERDALREQVPQWVPVAERMPDDNDPIDMLIAYTSNIDGWRVVCEADWDGELFTVNGDHFDFEQPNVTHWMPLPAPPRDPAPADAEVKS